MLHGNVAECLELCVLSCQYVGPKQKMRYGHGEWKKEEFLNLKMFLLGSGFTS